MAATSKPTRRSSSLQRMLDLEKKYMFQRLHPQPTPPTPPRANPQSLTTSGTEQNSFPERSMQARLDAYNTLTAPRTSGHDHDDDPLPPQLLPLHIGTGSPSTMRYSDLFMGRGKCSSAITAVFSTADNAQNTQDADVTFAFPYNETANCHSPSWEAYERYKKEKKNDKKERSESRNGRTRLTKPPPMNSSHESHDSPQGFPSEGDTSQARGRGRERSTTSSPPTDVKKESNPARSTRSRSNSFASMIRRSFDRRRSSSNQEAGNGFIGGIKLEMHRHSVHQQLLDSHAVQDESDIHPALRQANPNHRWSTPAKATQHPSQGISPENKRHYPPITRLNHAQKTSQAVPAIPDLSTIEKWRAKVRRNSGAREELRKGGNQAVSPNGTKPLDSPAKQQKSNLQMSKKKGEKKNVLDSATSKPMRVAFAAGTASPDNMDARKPDAKKIRDSMNNLSSADTGEAGLKPAPSLTAPPGPPQRSPKRNSTLSLKRSVPPLSLPCDQSIKQTASKSNKSPNQRSFPLCGHKQQSPQSTSSSPSTRHVNYMSSPTSASHPSTSHSEDSGSEDLHSTSIVSTPATSRPQSESNLPLMSSKDIAFALDDENRSPQLAAEDTTYPLNSDTEGPDPIQEAADKVLAAFNEIPIQSGGVCRSDSQSTLTSVASFQPSLRERPLNLRSRMNEPVLPTQAMDCSPAYYLQEARKQAPSRLPVRNNKQRLGPPASFAFPTPSDSNPATEKSTPILSVPEIVSRSLRPKSTPQLRALSRDPVAKVFVECCSCKHYHDMPSNLYEAMSKPEVCLKPAEKVDYPPGLASMTVSCSWCQHEMRVRCCAGLVATVYIKERLH